ncbi:MAG: NAD-dependent deacylase [Hyphomonadaceae bacterium]|nr:NAD-dependent deacylase [Hyphomonadaceae bacterium]
MLPERIFILTGAGISAESGLGTFRDEDGLWTQVNLEDVASIDGYIRDPKLVLDFYNMRRRNLRDARPNAAHEAVAALQRAWSEAGGSVFVCTQNVDDLHERGGAEDVVHMHGELTKARCEACAAVFAWTEDLDVDTACPLCAARGFVRPHIVWFGEMPFEMERIYEELVLADLFVAIGTSGAVYPAAGFVAEARRAGTPTLEINLAPSDTADAFDDARYGRATETVPAWVRSLLVGEEDD